MADNESAREIITAYREGRIAKPPPYDSRFPNTNQTKRCVTSFLDYKRCVKLRGEDYEPCGYFLNAYKNLCPHAWVEKWENQIAEGKYPHKI